MQHISFPVIDANELSNEALSVLRDFSFGYDGPPDGGFSFIVSTNSLWNYIKDSQTDMAKNANYQPPAYPEILQIFNELKTPNRDHLAVNFEFLFIMFDDDFPVVEPEWSKLT